MLQKRKINLVIFLIAFSFALSLFSLQAPVKASEAPLSFVVLDLLSNTPASGQPYDLTDDSGQSQQLVTDAQGVLNLGVLQPGFYTLEQIRQVTSEDGTVTRIVETRDIIRVEADGLQAFNGYNPPRNLLRIDPLDQDGSGLVFRFWDASTGIAAPFQSLTLTRAGYQLSSEEIEYRTNLESYLAAATKFVAAEEDVEGAEPSAEKLALSENIAAAKAELERLAALPSEDQVLDTYQSGLQGILNLGPLGVGKYYVTSPSFETMTFYITEESSVAYLGQSIYLPALPQTTTRDYVVNGPEGTWEVTGTLYLNGSPYRTASWTAQDPIVSFSDLPAYGPDRVEHRYHLVWDSLASYTMDVQDNVLNLTANPVETTTTESQRTTETGESSLEVGSSPNEDGVTAEESTITEESVTTEESTTTEQSATAEESTTKDASITTKEKTTTESSEAIEDVSSKDMTDQPVDMIEITFKPGGNFEIPSLTVEPGSLVKEPDLPDREGYEFRGWYYVDDEGNRHDFDFTINIYIDIILIADWIPIVKPTTTESTTTEPTTTESTTTEPTTTESTTTEPTTTESTTTEPTTTESTTTEPTTTETMPFPTVTFPTVTLPSMTLPSQTLPSQTLPSQTVPSQTLPSLPDFTRPTMPTISPDQPSATLPPRPGAQGGGVQRPSPAARPGGELLGDGSGFTDSSANPPTYDPGITPLIIIAVTALLGILVLEIWQRRRKD